MSYKYFVYALLMASLYTHNIKPQPPIAHGACDPTLSRPMSPDFFPSSRASAATAYVHYHKNTSKAANSSSSTTTSTHAATQRSGASSPVVSVKA